MVHLVYRRAVEAGAGVDIVRMEAQPRSLAGALDLHTFRRHVEGINGPPLIAVTKGQHARLGSLINTLSTPIFPPSIPSTGRFGLECFVEIQQGLLAAGFSKKMPIFHSRRTRGKAPNDQLVCFQAGLRRLNLPYEIELHDEQTDCDNAPLALVCRSLEVSAREYASPSALFTLRYDVMVSAATRYHNVKSLAISGAISRGLSPINSLAMGPPERKAERPCMVCCIWV